MCALEGRRLRVCEGVVSAEVGDEVILLEADSGTYFALDSVGRVVWKRLQALPTFAEVRAAIASEYKVPPATVHSDLQTFIQDLIGANLVRLEGDIAGSQ